MNLANIYTVSTFYAFFSVEERLLVRHQKALVASMQKHAVKGTIILATEGVNATIAGEDEGLCAFVTALKNMLGCAFTQRISSASFQPFSKAKVKVKPSLIKLGADLSGADLSKPEHVGTYVSPQDWNALISRADVVVLDTRNRYETHIGSFKGAVDPNTRNFNQLPTESLHALNMPKDKPIATFCTGGIRCEKYTAWLKEQGYTDVYHLQGGILHYLAEIPEEQSLWEGSCYVFDERIAVKHGMVMDESVAACPSCGHSLTARDLKSELYVHGEHCPHCETFAPSNAGEKIHSVTC
jgi:UPF0176 protein